MYSGGCGGRMPPAKLFLQIPNTNRTGLSGSRKSAEEMFDGKWMSVAQIKEKIKESSAEEVTSRYLEVIEKAKSTDI